MRKCLLMAVLLGASAILALPAAANPLPDIWCGWENEELVLGLFGTGDPPLIVTNVTAPDPVHDGAHSLRLEDNSPTGTPQAYVAYIWGLEDGDVVQAGFYRYDDTPDAAPSCRIWGHWNDELPGNPEGHSGSAGGNSDYGLGTGWEEVSHSWTVEEGHTGLVVEIRIYSNPGDTIWIDDLTVLPLEDVTIEIPGLIVVATEPQSLSDVKRLYR